MSGTRIVSTGRYLPERSVANDELKQFPPGSGRLVEQKTGVKARRIAERGQATSDLGLRAARDCLAKCGIDPLGLDAIILATSSPDRMQPATATRIQHALGARNAFAFDINSVCSGSIYALVLADSLLRSGTCSRVLVVTAEIYSRIMNPADFATYPYFGDGAAAVLLDLDPAGASSITSVLHTDGAGADVITVPSGGTVSPCHDPAPGTTPYFTMKGREVYDFAVSKGPEVVLELIAKTGIDRDSISLVISHQANANIIGELSRRTAIPIEKFPMNLARYGNTAGASTLIVLDEVLSDSLLRRGDSFIMVAFGGGLSWGASLVVY